MQPASKALSTPLPAPLDSGLPRSVLADSEAMEALQTPVESDVRFLEKSDATRLLGEAAFLTAISAALFIALLVGDPPFAVITVVAYLLGMYVLVGRIQWELKRVLPTEDGVAIMSRGLCVHFIPYDDIESYYIEADKSAYFAIRTRSGSPNRISIPSGSFIVNKEKGIRSIARRMVSHLPANAIVYTSKIIPNKVKARVDAANYRLPAVVMQPNVQYRYANPFDFSRYVSESESKIAVLPILLALLVVCILLRVPSGAFYPLAVGARPLFAAMLQPFRPAGRLRAAAHDKLELLEDGSLKVTRKNKTFILRERPRAANGLSRRLYLLDAPVLRFDRGLGTYYFDPRFIEPDV